MKVNPHSPCSKFFLNAIWRCSLSLFVVIWLSQLLKEAIAQSTIAPLPNLSGTNAGAIHGEFEVTDFGSAHYSIPIVPIPGAAGMEPRLSLNYDNRTGNGILGIGWSLSGLSTIVRCPATVAQDGFVDGVDFDSNDKFCLDGKRLIAVNGTYGANGTEYRTENESFARIVSYGNAANMPEYFEVHTKSGLIYWYGGAAYSRIEAQNRTDSLVWQVNKIQDTAGNYMDFLYFEDNVTGEHYITGITYTANVAAGVSSPEYLQFVYESSRPDPIVTFVSGSKVTISNRLKEIKLFHIGNLVRKYVLTYEQGASTGRSRITQIDECDGQGTCLQPTTFSWQDAPNGLPGASPSGTGGMEWWSPADWGNRIYEIGEFTGRGRTDLASFQSDGVYIWRMGDNGILGVELWNTQNWMPNVRRHATADMNGDGFTDIISLEASGLYVYKSTGNGLLPPEQWSGADWNSRPFETADFNGDNLIDFASFQSDGIYIWKSTGNGFSNIEHWATENWMPNVKPHAIADVNGDDLADIISPESGGLFVRKSAGNGLMPVEQWSTAPWHWRSYGLADVNGDRLIDLVTFQTDGIWAWISSGNSFSSVERWSTENWDPSFREHDIADINGDGLSDFISYQSSGLKVWRSTGTSLIGPEVWSTEIWTRRHLLADVTGDGKIEPISLQTDGMWVWRTANGTSDKLVRVTNGHGKRTDIEYKLLTDSNVYTRGTGAAYPILDLQAALPVVSSYSIGDGQGTAFRFNYYYDHLRAGLNGRGLFGFENIISIDMQTGVQTKNIYRQDYPYIAHLTGSETRLADNTLIRQILNTWSSISSSANTHFTFIGQSIENEFEITGTPSISKSISNNFDNYGNLTTSTTSYGDGYTEVINNTYTNDPINWFLGRLINTQVTKQAPGQAPITRLSSFAYSSNTGLLVQEIVEPNHQTLRSQKDYQYDLHGNIIVSSISGPSIATRTQSTQYDPTGRFPILEINALGHQTTKVYDPETGTLLSISDPNGITTTYDYDTFGRLIHTYFFDGTVKRNIYYNADTSSPLNARYYLREDGSGQAPKITYYDSFDREIRTETLGFNGQKIFIDKEYDSIGRLVKISDPYFLGDNPNWTNYAYDSKNRIASILQPGNRLTTTSYNGLSTTTVNPLNQVQTNVVNMRGKLVSTTDHYNKTTTYTYDSSQNLVQVRDSLNNLTSMQYDLRGNKIVMNDPDSGATTYVYNELGLMTSQTNSANETVTYTYDLLNRPLQRIEPEGTTIWLYDTLHKGKLSSVTGVDGFYEQYHYDNLSRLAQTDTVIDGTTYSVTNVFDQYGHLNTLQYPTNFAVQYLYNNFGYLTSVKRLDTGRTVWRADHVTARGQLEQVTFGNGIVAKRSYDLNTGYINRIVSMVPGRNTIQDLGFVFDDLGNLLERRDNNANLLELSAYDGLNRLIQTQVLGGTTVYLTYNEIGNILSKSDVGAYSYGGSAPHAVTSISGNQPATYSYDIKGNRVRSTAQGLQKVAFTSFNKPIRITIPTAMINFNYDSERNLYKQTKSIRSLTQRQLETTIYIDKFYEKQIQPTAVTEKFNITANGDIVAVVERTNTSSQTRYLHKDHLGSVESITDDAGNVVQKLSYDAWGLRRSTNWMPLAGVAPNSLVSCGFTGHYDLNDAGLVHMGGRVYDPTIGRFLSVDPFIQDFSNQQNLNRYSYVLNNPLSYTDPDGYFFKKLFRSLLRPFKSITNSTIGNIIFSAALYSIPGVGPYLAAGFQAANGFANGAELPGVIRSTAISLAVQSVGGSVITANISSPALVFVAHGVTRGVSTVIQGGKFEHGFFSYVVQVGFEQAVGRISAANTRISDPLEKIGKSSAGTYSEIGGGKYASGAVTEAFAEVIGQFDSSIRFDTNFKSLQMIGKTAISSIADRSEGIGGLRFFSDNIGTIANILDQSRNPFTKLISIPLSRLSLFGTYTDSVIKLSVNPYQITPWVNSIIATAGVVPILTPLSFGYSGGQALGELFGEYLKHKDDAND